MPMASTNLANRITDTITRSHNDSLGLKLVFVGNLIFNFFLFHFHVLIKIHEHASEIIFITYHRIKGICLSFKMRPSSMV